MSLAIILCKFLDILPGAAQIYTAIFSKCDTPISEIPAMIEELNDIFFSMKSSKAAAFYFASQLIYPEDQNLVPIDIGRALIGFGSNFSDKNHALLHYVEHVRHEIIEKYIIESEKKVYYYSLYFAVTQSSGYGKSRIMPEAGKKHLNTVYGCVRNEDYTGYPFPNSDLLTFLRNHNSVKQLSKFLIICYLVATEYLKENHQIKREHLPLSDFLFDSFDSFWKSVIKAFNSTKFTNYMALFKQHQDEYAIIRKNAVYRNGLLNGQVPSELVIVFDEAKTLLRRNKLDLMDDGSSSVFRNLRRALRQISSKNMVLVFTDTLSSISNFAPASAFDPSFRPEAEFNLLPPFYEVLTYDSLKILAESHGLVIDNFDHHHHYFVVFSQGRPLWAALYLHDFNDVIALSELIYYARQKLSNNRDAKLNNELAIVATIAVRCGINGVLDHHLGSALMSSYMGTGTLIEMRSMLTF